MISPLIALMRDQVDALLQKDIPYIALHSGMTYYEVQKVLQQATHGDLKFLYLSPERLESSLFKEYLPALNNAEGIFSILLTALILLKDG